MLKSSVLFNKKYKLHKFVTRELLGLKMRNFQGIILYENEHMGRFSNLH